MKKDIIAKNSNIWQAIKFTLFSISAGVIQILSFTLLSEFVFVFEKGAQEYTLSYYGWSYFISLALSVLWNFTFNRKFTFKSANNVPIAMLLTFLFYVVFTPLSILWGMAMVRAGVNNYLVLAITMVINFITEFLYQRFVVFRKSINTAQKKKKSADVQPGTEGQTGAAGTTGTTGAVNSSNATNKAANGGANNGAKKVSGGASKTSTNTTVNAGSTGSNSSGNRSSGNKNSSGGAQKRVNETDFKQTEIKQTENKANIEK